MKTSVIGGIPVFEALINDEADGMVRISLVDLPAVMSDFQTFAGQKPQRFAVADEDQRLIRGVIMRADFPIYRRDESGEYYLIYKADTIRQMAEKYLAESRQNAVDTMHDGNEVDGVQMVQYFIKDTEKGIAPAGFEDIADGSLFAEFHCTNDEVWEQVKAGTFRGFSLEGYFGFRPDTDQAGVDGIVDELEGKFNSADNATKKEIMSKVSKTLERIRQILEADAPQIEVKMGRVATDRGVLGWDGEKDLEQGDRVFIIDADGNTAQAEDGDYKTEDGKTIVVVNGEVAEIRDPEAEVAPEPEAEAEAVEQPAGEATEAAEAEEAPAAEPEAEPDYKALYEAALAEIEDLQRQLADAVAANTALEAEAEQLRAVPTAQPAHEEVRAASEIRRTGNKRLDRIAELMGKF